MTDPLKADRKKARHDRRVVERLFPAGLRRDLQVVRRDDLGDELAGHVLEDAREIADRQGHVREVRPWATPPWSYVPPVVQREILTRLEENETYRQRVRSGVRRTLRTEHLIRVDPGAVISVPSSLGRAPQIQNGKLFVDGDVGLGTGSVVEAEPEAWNHWVYQEIARRVALPQRADIEDTGFDEAELYGKTRVLVIGALAGGFARVVAAMTPKMVVTEFDWIFQTATNLPCVERRELRTPLVEHDAVILVMPSPAMRGACNYRHLYNTARPYDPGRLGPSRWKRDLVGILGLASMSLHLGGFLYALMPMGTRFGSSYILAPDLLDEAVDCMPALGFDVVDMIETVEVQAVAQPFVGKTRPPKITLVLRKTKPMEGT